ncbi:MAG: serine/threonine-protein kinase [Planctomycetota bacterium]|nr:serine/threonine-protein kinase [Planctomycetota bacterium]
MKSEAPPKRNGQSTDGSGSPCETVKRLETIVFFITLVLVTTGTVAFTGRYFFHWSLHSPQILSQGANSFCRFALLGLSIAVLLLTRFSKLSAKQLLTAGQIYQVVGAALLAFPLNYAPIETIAIRPGLFSWLAIWIVLFPLVAPLTPRRNLTLAFIAATTAPLIHGAYTVLHDTPWPTTEQLFSAYHAYYFSAAFSLAPALIVHRLETRLDKAQIKLSELGSYRLVERIGKGGMGEVWRAEHAFLVRPAAVKLLPQIAVSGSEPSNQDAVARFFREAQATADLTSPHTITIFDFGITDEDQFFYAMELLNGTDLENLVTSSGPLAPERVAYLLIQACASLGEAHEHGFVHRDIKPSNLFTSRQGMACDFLKVLDFGLVTSLEPTPTSKLTSPNLIMGTPLFMAPEQTQGKPMDGRSDLYALGCVAYFLLCGHPPFLNENAINVMVDHCNKTPPPIPQIPGHQRPPKLDAVIFACLEKKPVDRPKNARELADSLRSIDFANPWTEARANEWWEQHQLGGVNDKQTSPRISKTTRTLIQAKA